MFKMCTTFDVILYTVVQTTLSKKLQMLIHFLKMILHGKFLNSKQNYVCLKTVLSEFDILFSV